MASTRGGHGSFDGSGKPPANPVIDLKVILSKEEVAYLFGFDGVLLGQLRAQTGANVGITDGDSHEYVLCVGGTLDIIFKAFSLVCRKLWDFLTGIAGPNHNRPLNLRLAVPSSQCGSIIGKQGSKVKEIRDLTGANIQVSQESLPDSTERAVDISGSGEACLQSTYHICLVMQDTPLRGEIVPYIPSKRGNPFNNQAGMDMWRPVFLCGDRAYIIDGRVARPCPPELLRQELAKTAMGGEVAADLAMMQAAAVENGSKNGGDQPSTHQIGSSEHMNPLALISAISRRNGSTSQSQTSKEMSVSKDLVMLIVAKVDEIQRMSGAQIHVGGMDDDGPGDRLLTISGTEESILLAQFLIQSNIDLILKQGGGGGGGGLGGGFGQAMMPNPNLGSHAFDNVQQQGSGNSRFNDRRVGRQGGGGSGGGGRNQGRKSPGGRSGGRSRGGRR